MEKLPCEKEKVPLEHTLQQVVIITHLLFNYHLKTCRTFGLIQGMSSASSHDVSISKRNHSLFITTKRLF